MHDVETNLEIRRAIFHNVIVVYWGWKLVVKHNNPTMYDFDDDGE